MNKNNTFITIALLFFLGIAAPASAQETETKTQTWYGVLDAGALKLRMQVEIDVDDAGKLTGKAISLDQGSAEMIFDELTLNDEEMAFTVKAVGAEFSGKMNADKTIVDGTFKQGGAKLPFKLEKVDKVPTQTHVETWTGKLKAGPQEFDFQFRVFEDDEKVKSAKLDSFNESLEGIPCDIGKEGAVITIKVPIAAAPATFTGTYDGEKKEIIGDWDQGGNKYPLTLKQIPLQSTREVKLNRPQTPKPPFDYDSENVTIENKKDGLTLAGTLTTPKGDGPFPVVVLVSGSGPQDRDETLFSHKPFLVIADHLAKNGIGVLRYDDRGTADSTGDFGVATTADFANDTEAVFEFLKSHKKADADKLFLCGHSEGGLITPMVASRRDDVAGIVMLAGPGVDGRQISFNQSRLMAAAAGAKESAMKVNDDLLKKIYEAEDKGETLDEAFIEGFVKNIEASISEEDAKEFDAAKTTTMIRLAIARADSPWTRFFGTYDPAPALTKVKCPVLAMVGEKDLQVDPKLNNPAIEKALKAGGNEDFQVTVLPSLNHLLQKCDTGSLSEYNQIEHTIHESALELLTSWLQERVK